MHRILLRAGTRNLPLRLIMTFPLGANWRARDFIRTKAKLARGWIDKLAHFHSERQQVAALRFEVQRMNCGLEHSEATLFPGCINMLLLRLSFFSILKEGRRLC